MAVVAALALSISAISFVAFDAPVEAAGAKKKAQVVTTKSCGTYKYRDKTGKCVDARDKKAKK